MKQHFSFRFNPNRLFILMLLGMTCLCQNVKADCAGPIGFGVTMYIKNGNNVLWNDGWWEGGSSGVSNKKFQNVTDFYLKGAYFKYWKQKDCGNVCTTDSKMYYAIFYNNDGLQPSDWKTVTLDKAVEEAYTDPYGHNNAYVTLKKKDDATFDQINVLDGLYKNGTYTLVFNHSTKGSKSKSDQCSEDLKVDNGGSNYAIIFTYNPSTYITFGAGTAYATMGTVKCNGSATSPVWKYKNNQITFTAEPKTGYELEGWYDNAACTGPKLSNDTEYKVTYSSENNASVYAKFVSLSTVTLVGFTMPSTYAGNRTQGSATISIPSGKEYVDYTATGGVNTVTTVGNVLSFYATEDGTLTANFRYLQPQVAHAGTANYTVGGAAIKLNPTYTNVANDATYTWKVTSGNTDNITISNPAIANPNITITAEGTYVVMVTVSQDKADPKSANKTITITASGTGAPTCGSCFNY